jgi:hypothetical protein
MSESMRESDRPALQIGHNFADYRIEELAGRQRGVGRVYVATHLESERSLEFPPWPVALKVFSPPDGQEDEFLARFEEAAKLQATLHHPNVVSVYEYGTQPAPFMSMTLFKGPNLADLIASRTLDEPMMLPIFTSVAAALDGGIEHGLTYRRLRPGGILVATDSQRAFLSDFGVGRSTSLTGLLDNEELGTFVDYASPEEARSSEVSVASNVYSLAAIVFECLTGETPFPHQEGEHALQARLEGQPRKLRQLRPDLPHGLESVLARALSDEPHRRPASPGQLAKAIERAWPKRRRRGPRLRATAPLARTPPLPAADPAAVEAPAVVPEPETEPRREPKPEREARPKRGAAVPAAAAGATAAAAPTREEEAPTAAAKPERKARGALWPVLVLGTLLVAGAAVLGALVAPSSGSKPAPTPAKNASVGPASLNFPANWHHLATAPSIPGLDIANATALTSAAGPQPANPSRALVAGTVAQSQLAAAGAPQPVDLGAVQAYRYRGVKRAGLTGLANLYLVPRSGGDSVVVGCIAPSASDPFMGRCERVASTLELKAPSSAIALAPSPTYAAGLRRVMGRLDAVRTNARKRLGGAKTPAGQAGNAARISIAYRQARRAASGLTPPPGARAVHASVVDALSRAGRAYGDMAHAGRTHANGNWSAARRDAVAAEQSLQQALKDLQGLGYQAQSG